MSTWLARHPPSRGWLRWALRLPIWLYRARLGWLLGHRFLLLTHTGRKSGRQHRTVLEVVRYDPAAGVYVVASGWGPRADWFRNVLVNPQVVVEAAGRRVEAVAERLAPPQAEQALRDYARASPLAFREISWLATGERMRGTPEDCRRLAGIAPLVELRPH